MPELDSDKKPALRGSEAADLQRCSALRRSPGWARYVLERHGICVGILLHVVVHQLEDEATRPFADRWLDFAVRKRESKARLPL